MIGGDDHRLAPFRQRYPKVLLDDSRMLVPSDRGVTGGAAMGHLDLTLWLIRKTSPELATLVSRYLLADIRSLQAPVHHSEPRCEADPLIARFERWARENLKDGFSLAEAAGAIATSARTLQRRCEAGSANRRSPTFRTSASSARNPCSTAPVSTSTPSRRKWATSTERHWARCYASAWDGACASFAPTFADKRLFRSDMWCPLS